MKKLKFILIAFIATFMIPTIVNAETVTVKFKTNPSSSDVAAEIEAEKDVTTVGDLRAQIASLVDMEKYILLDNWYSIPSDESVICSTNSLSCYQTGTGYTSNLYLIEMDNTAKPYTIKSIIPKDEMMAQSIFETNYEMFEPLSFRLCDDTYTTCTFLDYEAFKAYTNVKITYDYDKNLATIAQKAVDDGLINSSEFEATDVELINYLLYGGSLANYTSSFKNQLSNFNFVSEIDQRGGAFEPFNTAAIGFYRATYNGTLYAIKDFVEINAPHVIYIPTDATDKVEAVKQRLKDILGTDASKLLVEESTDTINELLVSFDMETVGEIGDETYLIITNNDADSPFYGVELYFGVNKDSSKINNTVSFKSSDLITNVSVETDGDIPLDTIIGVNHITSGDTYDKLMSVLSIDDGEVFDISLNSIAQKKNITKLDNGKFLVKIPVPSKYEGKDLIVYYVDDSKTVTSYEVTVKDGYATFETDHFSTYTLTINSNENTVSNPKTGDNIINYVIMLLLSLGALIVIYTKKKKNY